MMRLQSRNIKDFYENDQLVALTKELTEMLRKNRTIDWQKKETARATMRKMVKRLLKKYKYPPEEDDSGFLFFVIATLLIKTYSSFEDIVYRIMLVAVRYFLGSK